MKSEDDLVDDFVKEHDARKTNGAKKRNQRGNGQQKERRIHNVERKDKWRFNPNKSYNDEED